MASGTVACRPCPCQRVRHGRDDGGYYERLRNGLLGYDMIHVYQEELLVLILALYHP
jgi:hypothetical protein